MGTVIATQVVPQGLLVPRSALGEWLERGVETVREKEQIGSWARPAILDEREDAIRILEEAGLLVKPDWEPVVPAGFRCRTGGAGRKFSVETAAIPNRHGGTARRGGEVLSGYQRLAQEIRVLDGEYLAVRSSRCWLVSKFGDEGMSLKDLLRDMGKLETNLQRFETRFARQGQLDFYDAIAARRVGGIRRRPWTTIAWTS